MRPTRPPRIAKVRRPVRRRFAQHFLEPAWVAKVVAAIRPAPAELFFEIGPGHGALTEALVSAGATIVAVEIDRDLAAALRARLLPRVTIVTADVLEVDLAELTAAHRLAATTAVRVVGNLPYNISSPALFHVLRTQRLAHPFADATLMFQREVADRLVAQPGSQAYGPPAVLAQLQADVTRLLSLPPGAFRPRPKVRSAVVRLAFRPSRVPIADPDFFEQVIRRVFQHRRKMLVNAIAPLAAERALAAGAVLATAGLDGRRRPETLQLAELARLAVAFTRRAAERVL